MFAMLFKDYYFVTVSNQAVFVSSTMTLYITLYIKLLVKYFSLITYKTLLFPVFFPILYGENTIASKYKMYS